MSAHSPEKAPRFRNYVRIGSSLLLSGITGRCILSGLPFAVMIEPTNRCNLLCALCPTGMGTLARKRGDMPVERMRTLVRELPREVSLILFWGMGEPFMADSLFTGVTEAAQRGIRTRTSTNGHFLVDNGRAAEVLESGLDELVVSLDGVCAETYQKYRKGGDFNRVVEGVRELRGKRDAQGKSKPRLILQFLATRHNEEELGKLNEFAAQIGADNAEVKTLQAAFTPQGGGYVPEKGGRSRYRMTDGGLEPARRRFDWGVPCRRLWYSAVITWEGEVNPCCFDRDSRFVMGNVFQKSLHEIWRGRPYRKFRETLLTDGRVFPMCHDCTEGLRRKYIRL